MRDIVLSFPWLFQARNLEIQDKFIRVHGCFQFYGLCRLWYHRRHCCDRFPIEYYRVLNTGALTRHVKHELSSIAFPRVVETKHARLRRLLAHRVAFRWGVCTLYPSTRVARVTVSASDRARSPFADYRSSSPPRDRIHTDVSAAGLIRAGARAIRHDTPTSYVSPGMLSQMANAWYVRPIPEMRRFTRAAWHVDRSNNVRAWTRALMVATAIKVMTE
jgi:hypothetical protein